MSMKLSSRQVDGLQSRNAGQPAADERPVPRRSSGMRKIRRIGWNMLPPLTFVAIIAIWAAAVRLFDIPPYVMPGPGLVFSRLVEEYPQLWTNSIVTVTEIVWGFGLTIVTAIPVGLVIALSPLAKQVVYPPLMFLQLVPKIAVAPLFLVWLGFGMESKVLLTVLMTFFPLLLASISGFQILDNRLLYLTQSMGASSWQTFRYLRFPAALPVIFSGIKTSATIAATAAIVAEFVGANKGLGYVLLRGTSTLDIGLTFAVIAVLTFIGIAINYIVEFAEWAMTPWQRDMN
ncbi:ABC nitrate/sulfonate/bicarbonate transporter, inner membrane subunit [Caballeronia cordobensis]|uniref:ABC nitrate/sulfonate/bicarbonate transporter, inner membrane subunit n=1 Tax=Caballeronia cordobensis TaxID=1353886 RepID=A0A158GFI0_CABCO|nr:ABC transporter permease [Caballeronia cordobensis]SAL30389.1 ABC nitrate/sulfonate/bicarbonate transporter, inner membrane subunit [Caballeronia cordobensis]